MGLIAATRSGICLVTSEGAESVWRGDVRCLARVGSRVFAGSEGAGVLCSDDDGASWGLTGLVGVRIRSLAGDGARVLVGAQPVAVHLSEDSGGDWRELGSFPRRPYWWQPAMRPHRQGYVSALAVESGTILAGIEGWRGFRSGDGGASWRPLKQGFSRDCHALVLAHGRGYQGAGLGPSWSVDSGSHWTAVRHGLDRRYVMTIAVDPADPECWYVAAAPLLRAHSRDSRARIYRWSASGWTAVSDELRELPHALLCPEPDALVAGLRDGTIQLSSDRGRTWRTIAVTDGLRALA